MIARRRLRLACDDGIDALPEFLRKRLSQKLWAGDVIAPMKNTHEWRTCNPCSRFAGTAGRVTFARYQTSPENFEMVEIHCSCGRRPMRRFTPRA